MLNCEEVTELCSRELEERISRGQRFGLGVHLMMCSGCRNYRQQLHLLRHAMNTYAEGRAATHAPAPQERGEP